MTDAFFSYARQNLDRVKSMVDALRSEGFSIYFDVDLKVGNNYIIELNERLRDAQAIIVAWSKVSTRSRWVLSEAMFGFNRNVLVPILIEEDVDLPVPFNGIHTHHLHHRM